MSSAAPAEWIDPLPEQRVDPPAVPGGNRRDPGLVSVAVAALTSVGLAGTALYLAGRRSGGR